MHSAALTAVAAFASLAQAVNKPLPVPQNGQIGTLDFTIDCTALGFYPLALEGSYTGTAPYIAEEGQQAYLTDVTANLNIPAYIVQLGELIGATRADTKLFIDVNFTNADPSPLHAFPDGLWVNNTQLSDVTSSGLLVHVPADQPVIDPIGPYTLGSAGVVNNIFLGAITAEIYLYNKTGAPVLFPISISCPQQNPDLLLALINVVEDDGGQSTTLEPQLGFVPDYPKLGDGDEYGCFQFNYQCTAGQYGPLPYPVEACAGISATDKAGSEFYIYNTTAFLTVPGDVVGALSGLFPGSTQLDTTVDAFYIGLTNGSPDAINGLKSPLEISGPIPTDGGNITLAIPQDGTLTIGPYTAGTNIGEIMYLLLGNATAKAVLSNSDGQTGELDVVCVPPIDQTRLIGISITNGTTTSAAGGFPGLPTSFPGLPTSFPGLPTGLPTGFSFPTSGFAFPTGFPSA